MQREFQRYLRHHRAEGHSDKTTKYYRDCIERSFFPFLQAHGHDLSLDNLTADTVLDWVDDQRSRGLSQKTVSTRVIAVKAFSRWLAAEDYVPRDPLARMKVPKVDDTPKATLAPKDVETLLKTCDRNKLAGRRDVAMLLLLFSTGLRASEVVGMQPADIDWDRGLITIRRGKGGKARVVLMGAKVEKALHRYVGDKRRSDRPHVFLNNRGEPLPYRGLTSMLTHLERATGVHCYPHKWRHSAAVAYLRGGGRVETLKALLGHSTLDMTLHYARIAGVDLATAHETADPARSLKV